MSNLTDLPGVPEHQHEWYLVETGYERQWSIDLDEEAGTITAYYGGSEDFSEDGDGDEHLRCALCLETKPLPEGWEISYE